MSPPRKPKTRRQEKDTALGISFAKEVLRMHMPYNSKLSEVISEHRLRAVVKLLKLINRDRPDKTQVDMVAWNKNDKKPPSSNPTKLGE